MRYIVFGVQASFAPRMEVLLYPVLVLAIQPFLRERCLVCVLLAVVLIQIWAQSHCKGWAVTYD